MPFSLVGIKKAGNHFDSLHGVLLCFCVVLMITCLYKMLRKLVRRIRERFKFCVNRKTDIRYVISYRGQNLFFRVLSLFVL